MKIFIKTLAMGALLLALVGVSFTGPATPAQAVNYTTGQGCTANVYKRGGYSHCVGYLQTMLNGMSSRRGYVLVVDNSYGTKTYNRVREFQSTARISSDGVVGPTTWNWLCANTGYNFKRTSTKASERKAWKAAYQAGCRVQSGNELISRY